MRGHLSFRNSFLVSFWRIMSRQSQKAACSSRNKSKKAPNAKVLFQENWGWYQHLAVRDYVLVQKHCFLRKLERKMTNVRAFCFRRIGQSCHMRSTVAKIVVSNKHIDLGTSGRFMRCWCRFYIIPKTRFDRRLHQTNRTDAGWTRVNFTNSKGTHHWNLTFIPWPMHGFQSHASRAAQCASTG